MESPILGIPILSRTQKITCITKPRSFATGPIIKVEFCVKTNSNIFPPYLRDRIISSLRKWITTQNSPRRKDTALEGTILLYRIQSVSGTGRKIRTFGAFQWR